MHKNQFNKRIGANSRSARGKRYSTLSATARRNDGEESNHSMRELANMSRQRHRGSLQSPITTQTRRSKKAGWYAIADPHMPTWGVYTDWQEVVALKPGHYKGFHSEHAAMEWLERESIRSTAPVKRGKHSSKSKSRRSKNSGMQWSEAEFQAYTYTIVGTTRGPRQMDTQRPDRTGFTHVKKR